METNMLLAQRPAVRFVRTAICVSRFTSLSVLGIWYILRGTELLLAMYGVMPCVLRVTVELVHAVVPPQFCAVFVFCIILIVEWDFHTVKLEASLPVL